MFVRFFFSCCFVCSIGSRGFAKHHTDKAGENLNFGINKHNEMAVEYQAHIEFVLTTLWVGPGIDTECFWPQLLGGATVY